MLASLSKCYSDCGGNVTETNLNKNSQGVLDSRSGLVPSNFVIDLEAVLSLRSEMDEKDQNLSQGISKQIPSHLMTVNSS